MPNLTAVGKMVYLKLPLYSTNSWRVSPLARAVPGEGGQGSPRRTQEKKAAVAFDALVMPMQN